MNCPYKLLGVRKNATAKSIQKAYRKLAFEHHPDRGGDVARFAEIQRAYDCLSDPPRRKRFDETGDWGGQCVDSDLVQIGNILGGVMPMILQQIIDQQGDIEHLDFADLIRMTLRNGQTQLRENERKTMMQVMAWKKTLGKWRNENSGTGLLESIARRNIETMERLIANYGKELAAVKKALAFMEGVGFEYAEQIHRTMMTTGSTGRSWSWTTI